MFLLILLLLVTLTALSIKSLLLLQVVSLLVMWSRTKDLLHQALRKCFAAIARTSFFAGHYAARDYVTIDTVESVCKKNAQRKEQLARAV